MRIDVSATEVQAKDKGRAMAVMECNCGMVMSVSAAMPRKTCIRCGGMNLHELKSLVPKPTQLPRRSPLMLVNIVPVETGSNATGLFSLSASKPA
jgi:hypothetical protein